MWYINIFGKGTSNKEVANLMKELEAHLTLSSVSTPFGPLAVYKAEPVREHMLLARVMSQVFGPLSW